LEEDHPISIFIKVWFPAVALSHHDGRHNADALLLKAALIQLSNYRLTSFMLVKSSLELIFIVYIYARLKIIVVVVLYFVTF
jgi:hypothetical protein